MTSVNRYSYIDNLRAFAFLMMIVFHSLKIFSPEGWGIKLTTIDWSKSLAEIISIWRLPVLFFISGAAFGISILKNNIALRLSKKLLPLLIVGTPLLISAANYLHEVYINPGASYLHHLHTYFENALTGKLSWYHLWYLGYILVFVYIHQILHIFFKNKYEDVTFGRPEVGIFVLIIISLINEAFLRPYFPVKRDFIHDLSSIISFACFYVAGLIVIRNIKLLNYLTTSVMSFLIITASSFIIYHNVGFLRNSIGKTFVAWTTVLFLMGFFGKYLNIKSAFIEGIHGKMLDIYVIHQVTILGAVFCVSWLEDGSLKIVLIMLIGGLLAYASGFLKKIGKLSFLKFTNRLIIK
jgi:glucans biosynthesis protein C